MDFIRNELVFAAIKRAGVLSGYRISKNSLTQQHKLFQQIVFANESLTAFEKSFVIEMLEIQYDMEKVYYNEGRKRICENCQLECYATLYCEHCVRNYLKAEYSNWTSGNNDIDDLIQECQIGALAPHVVIEWIPYNNLQNTEYLTKGGCSEIYTADWIDGYNYEWNSKEQQLRRFGTLKVILKKLENIESANRNWFDEVYNLKVLIIDI